MALKHIMHKGNKVSGLPELKKNRIKNHLRLMDEEKYSTPRVRQKG